MKFRVMLWLLGLIMAWASRTNPAFRQALAGKELSFLLHTLDGQVARHYVVSQQRVRSRRGVCAQPAFAVGFRDAAYGYATLTASNKQLAFMQGVQTQSIKVKGSLPQLYWFQGLFKHLRRSKKPAA